MPISLSLMYDIAILIIICLFVVQGFQRGFIPSIASFGIFFAIALGIVLNDAIAIVIQPLCTLSFIPITIQEVLIEYLPFVSFIVITIVFSIVWNITMSMIDIASKVTLLSLANSLVGAFFGLIKGIIIIFLLKYILLEVLQIVNIDTINQMLFFQFLSF